MRPHRTLGTAADFSGVDVLTYVVMDNHFHLCVRVPRREGEVPESEVLRRVSVLYVGIYNQVNRNR